jgi:AraC-like DNA-binding protein
MKYYKIEPPQSLADFVQFFWVLEGEATSHQPFVHRAIAESCPELIFYYKGQFDRCSNTLKTTRALSSGIYGQCEQYQTFETQANFGIFGIYLSPYALPLLFNLPANEISNQNLDIRNLCSKEGKFLEEKMMLASDNIIRAKIISDFLEARLHKIKKGNSSIVNSIRNIITTNDLISIPSLAITSNLSRRQFERKFIEYAGFSPKQFLNLVRFNSIIKKQSTKNKSLTQAAYDFGFYDQSHFIHNFKKLSGYCPSEYFKKNEGLDYREIREI